MESLPHLLTVDRSGQEVASRSEVLRDGTTGCEETLGLPGRLEPLHASLSLPRRLVGVFRPVVQIAMLPMLAAGQALAYGGTVASQMIGDDDSWNVREIFDPLAEELFRSRLIPAALHQDIKDVAVLIDGTPEIVACAVDPDKHLVQVPCVPRSRTSASPLIGILLHELQTPLTDRFLRHNDPRGEQELFDIALAEAKTEVQPDTIADNLRGEAVVFRAVGWNSSVHATIMAHRPGAV
jgi:hypothetical protein